MPYDISDRWMWLGFGVFLVAATKGIAYGLRSIVELNTLPPADVSGADDDVEARDVDDHEDAIPVEALVALTKSPNHDICNTAVDILTKRLSKSSVGSTSFHDDLFSDEPDVRRPAVVFFDLRQSWAFGLLPLTIERNAFDLTTLIMATVKSDGLAAMTIRVAYRHARDAALLDGDLTPMRTFQDLSTTLSDEDVFRVYILPDMRRDQVLAWTKVMMRLTGNQRSRSRAIELAKAITRLRRAGMDVDNSEAAEASASALTLDAERHIDGSPPCSGAGMVVREHGTASLIPRPRYLMESPEERRLRRRRREAMVWRDGMGELDESAIIQPRDTL